MAQQNHPQLFRGCPSAPKIVPGGTPHGTLLGVILYILYINPVGFPAEITNKVSDVVHKYWDILENQNEDEKLPDLLQSIKLMDDATIQEGDGATEHRDDAINLDCNIKRGGWCMVHHTCEPVKENNEGFKEMEVAEGWVV